MRIGIVSFVYLILGFFVASSNGYFVFDSLGNTLSAGLAILLWPLIFLGVDLHLG